MHPLRPRIAALAILAGAVATIVRKDENQVEIRWDCYTSALMFPKLTPSTLLLEEFEVLNRDPIFERVLARL